MTVTTSNTFEDRLLEQLRQVVAERPAPAGLPQRSHRRTRITMAGVSVAAATAAVAFVATSSNVTTSAYAVEPRADGKVTVEIHSLSDSAGLERSLRAAGVPAVVSYAPAAATACAGSATATAQPAAGIAAAGEHLSVHRGGGTTESGPSLTGPGPGPGQPGPGVTTTKIAVASGSAKFTIDPGSLKPAQKVYITTSTGSVDTIGMSVTNRPPTVSCATATVTAP